MKIIQVMPVFGMGGAEIMCENLVYELKKLGHEVIVLSLYSEKTPITERLEESCIDIRYLGKKDGFDFSMFKKLKNIFKQEKPDVIHTHIYVAKYVFPVASKMKIRVVHTVHNVARHEAGKISRIYNKFFFKHREVIPVALSSIVQGTIAKEYKIKSSRIPVIFNGINLNKCKVKNSYNYEKDFKIVHVGRFFEQKNHIGLVEAFKLFHDKYSNTKLWLIGEGEKKPEIESYVKESNMEDCVVFWGSQNEVHSFLNDADMFTLPSNYEGIPMTLIEAMGTGLPIVATAVGGVPNMLDENSAQLVEVDVKAICEAFEKYYLSEDLRKLHGENALKMSKRFSAEEMAKRYLELY